MMQSNRTTSTLRRFWKTKTGLLAFVVVALVVFCVPGGLTADDDDPCKLDPDICSTEDGYTGECEGVGDGYKCICAEGYENAQDDPTTCEDKNECANDDVCPPGNGYTGVCDNVGGGYKCICSNGYENAQDDPTTCEDKDECVNDLICHLGDGYTGVCENVGGGYKCICSNGYENPQDDPTTCEDIDECAGNDDLCLPSDGYTGVCENVGGGYKCICSDGYENAQDDPTTCEDKDECANDLICHLGDGYTGVCENEDGGYKCICSDGYENAQDDLKTCEDIDECDAGSDTCSAESDCSNLDGDYECICMWGWKRVADSNKDCEDIDECAEGVDGDESVTACNANAAICANEVGSYDCNCYAGYYEAPDADSMKPSGCQSCCADTNECASEDLHECGDLCAMGTQGAGAPLGTNYTCGCHDKRYPRDELNCDDCGWGQWSDYDGCSVTCGEGTSTRTRVPLDGFGQNEEECNRREYTTDELPCAEPPCIDLCEVTPWSQWSECTAVCAGGTTSRSREFVDEANSDQCESVSISETDQCNTEPCEAEPFNWKPIAFASAGVVAVSVFASTLWKAWSNNRRQHDYGVADDYYI